MQRTQKLNHLKGFTLIELMVVIAIIATLAATSFAIGPGLMNKARKVSALASATGISQAVEQFYTEYSALPDASGDSGDSTSDLTISTTASPGPALLDILSGFGDSTQNARKIRFLTAKEAKNNRDGIVFNNDASQNSVRSMYDPWGQPFYIRLDYDYDEALLGFNLGQSGASLPNVNLRQRRVAVYSLGVEVPSSAKATTLVKTW